MWYPPPVMVPIYLEPGSRVHADPPSAIMLPMVSVDQHVYLSRNEVVDHRISLQDGRKFLLNKFVFELVKSSHCLELTDPKLLGWYLSLPAEDRKLIQEGGGFVQFLQRHPALEITRHIVHLKQQIVESYLTHPATDMSSNLNRSRRATFYGASQCLNCGTSCVPGAKRCRCCSAHVLDPEENVCISEEEKTLGLLPNNVKEELNLLKAKEHSQQLDCLQSFSNNRFIPQISSSSSYQQQRQQKRSHSKTQLQCQLWKGRKRSDRKDAMVCKNDSNQASFSLDIELEMQCHAQSSYQDASADDADLDQETPPEYYSFNSTTPENLSGRLSDSIDASLIPTKGMAKASLDNKPVENSVTSGFENGTNPNSVSHLSDTSEYTDLTDCQALRNDDTECEMKKNEYHSVSEAAPSSAAHVCHVSSRQTSNDPKCLGSTSIWFSPEEFSSCKESILSDVSEPGELNPETSKLTKVSSSASQAVDASGDYRTYFTSNKETETSLNCFLEPCREASTCTNALTNSDQETQTAQKSTSEKYTITDVYMSDLDALVEEFGLLKTMEKELKHLKDKTARSSSGGQGRECLQSCCGCNAVQRAQWAELRLLSLHHVMCQQHCWRRFYTSPLGETALHRTGERSGEMSQTLKSLEDDYKEMKRKILAGVPLDNLKPLSVDTRKIASGTCYSPSLIWEERVGDVPHQEPSNNAGFDETRQPDKVLKMEPADGDLVSKNTASLQLESIGSKRNKAVSVLSQKPGASSDSKSGTHKDLSNTEAWFDAKEELGSDSQSCKEDNYPEQGARGHLKMEQKGDLQEERSRSLFRLTNVPSSVTECDLLLRFEKNTSQACLSTFNDNGVALVSARSHSDAEAAVREVNGQSIQGYTFQVEHVDKFSAHGRGPIKESCAELSPAGHEAKAAGDELNTRPSKINFQTSKCGFDKLTNVCDTPTASGTCVPRRYGRMGSFDTIMASLSERHPQVGRQRIISALLELRTKHQGILSGLPLREIVDMTSDLLTQVKG